jgi:hypothetical protein
MAEVINQSQSAKRHQIINVLRQLIIPYPKNTSKNTFVTNFEACWFKPREEGGAIRADLIVNRE